MKDWLEIQFWQIAKWLIVRGYGTCPESDLAGRRDLSLEDVLSWQSRCASCRAGEIVRWIDDHISLLK